MIDIGTILRHYKRPELQAEMISASKDREVAVKYGEKGFGKRPDTLSYQKDIIEFAKQGSTSFHVSEEHWSNVFNLDPALKKEELDDLRIGWDLVLDIDCRFWEYSKLTTHFLVQALLQHGVRSISCKFSGNKGFHIGVPFQAFPTKLHEKDTKLFFPEGAKRIAYYLAEFIRKPLSKEILKKHNIQQIMDITSKPFSEIVKDNKFNPLSIIDLDTLLISSRHLYRMPYALHEKSGLCSIPINPDKILAFEKEQAQPGNVSVSKFRFLDVSKTKENEAKELILQAFDLTIPEEEHKEKDYTREYETLTTAVPYDFFPPCIKKTLEGLEDGKKRSMFILINFLSNVGYEYDKIDEILDKWNKKNKEPLREVLLKGQLRYRKMQRQKVLPPNCSNRAYYLDFRVCAPDSFCRRIKNPVNYSILKTRIAQGREKGKREKLTEEQKEMRRKHRERLKKEKQEKA